MPEQYSNFPGLAEVDWSQYRHALGAADDVPEMLEALSSGDLTSIEVSAAHAGSEDLAIRAFAQLMRTIWHHGFVYSATPKVIPFLLQLLAKGRHSSLIQLLDAVSESACDEVCCEPRVAGEIRDELAKGLPIVFATLTSGETEERAAAARILGTLQGLPREAEIAVRDQLAKETEPTVREVLAETLSKLVVESSQNQEAESLELFQRAFLAGQKIDETLAEIVRYWPPAARLQKADADKVVAIGMQLNSARQLEFLTSLLPGSADGKDAITIARQLLILVFQDARPKWSTRSIGFCYYYNGKPWSPNNFNYAFSGVTVEQALSLQRRLVKARTTEERSEVMAELESMRAEPPVGAVKQYFCEYYPAKGAKPEWHLPLTSAQKRALSSIAASDLCWSWDTNLWSLFGLPPNREEIKLLIQS